MNVSITSAASLAGSSAISIIITWFRVEVGINKHEQSFQRPTKVHEPVGQVHFVVLEKFTSDD